MTPTFRRLVLALGAGAIVAASVTAPAASEKPVAGKQERFPDGYWSAVPQVRDGKVQQCVLVALRKRAGGIDTRLSLIISRGSGLTVGMGDARLPREDVLDDRAEIISDGKAYPAVGFTVPPANFAFHPGDAAGTLAAFAGAKQLTLRSTGAGIDSGPIDITLPADALEWLKQCGETFKIAIDRPTDPDAPPLPAPLPPSPEIGTSKWTASGPPGIDDKQKINTWDASELRDNQGRVVICMIRRHYASGSGEGAAHYASFFMVSRLQGLTAMLKNSTLKLTPNEPIAATLVIDREPFAGFSARTLSADEIAIYPEHPARFAAALGRGATLTFKSRVMTMEMPVQSAVIAWLRACARRHDISFER